MVFQSYHLLDDLTVRENIDLPLSYKDVPSRQRQGMVADTLDRFQIVAKKDLFPSQLSGGQQQLGRSRPSGDPQTGALARRRAHGKSALVAGARKLWNCFANSISRELRLFK